VSTHTPDWEKVGPDLLAALEAIIGDWDAETAETMKHIHPSWATTPVFINPHPLKVAARAAIARAKGETK